MKISVAVLLVLLLSACDDGQVDKEKLETKLDSAGEKIDRGLERAGDSIEAKVERLEDKIERKREDTID